MNIIERNPAIPPDEVDQLLRSFFRSEVPDPFPTMRAPAFEPRRQVPSWSGVRSKLALAASVALLLAASWFLSGRVSDYPTSTPRDGDSGKASRFDPLGAGKAEPGRNGTPK